MTRLQRWLEKLQGGPPEPVGWVTILDQFPHACREALVHGDLRSLDPWHAWTSSPQADQLLTQLALRPVAPWQRAWLGLFVQATLDLVDRARWPEREYPPDLPASLGKAWQAARQPDWPSLDEDALWHDLVRLILGTRPRVQRQASAVFPTVFPGAGVVLQLTLEILEWDLPGGGIFLDPAGILTQPVQKDFVSALQDAAEVARLTGWVRVRVEPVDPKDRVFSTRYPLQGPSAGGALYVGLQALRHGLQPEPGLAFSFAATLSSDLPHAVDRIEEKALACARHRISRLMVAADQAVSGTLAPGVDLIRVASLQEAVDKALGLATAVQAYLDGLREELDRTPWRDRQGQQISVSRMAVPIRVLKKVARVRRPQELSGKHGEATRRPSRLGDPAQRPYYEEPVEYEEREEVPWEQEMQQVRRAVILGAPGGGKTFLTRWTVLRLVEEARRQLGQGRVLSEVPLPVHVDLPRLAQRLGSPPSDPAQALAQELQGLLSQGTHKDRAPHLVALLQQNPQAWLVLDALDQVPEGRWAAVREWLVGLEGWSCRVVLTCRTARYPREAIPWRQAPEYELAPLEPGRIQDLFRNWLGDEEGKVLWGEVQGRPALLEACRSPLVASLTCLVYQDRGAAAVRSRGELYGEALRVLMQRTWQDHAAGLSQGESRERRLRVLEETAWKLFQEYPEVNDFGWREVEDRLREVLQELQYATLPPDQLVTEFQAAGILQDAGRARGESRLAFLHRTFLEYLAGRALAGQAQKAWDRWAGLVDRKAWHPAWWEVLVFMGWALEEGKALDRLMKLLADRDKDDYFRHRLVLALRILAERV